LLIALCFAISVGGALASAKIANFGFRGYALAVVVGSALGLFCAWTMWTVGNSVAANMKPRPQAVHERYFRALYLAVMLWIVLALFLGEWVSSVFLRLIF
jgi:hypothetical protein